MPTQAIPQGKHEAFESQFAAPHGCRNFTRDEGGYVVRQIESMWQAWLAGRASLAAVPAGTVASAPAAPNPWRDAVLEALTVNCIRRPDHEDDPVRALADLVKWERDEAAGPAPLPPVPGLTQHDFDRAADRGLAKWWDGVGGTEAGFIAAECFALHQSALSGPAPVPGLTETVDALMAFADEYAAAMDETRSDFEVERKTLLDALTATLSLPKPEAAEPAPPIERVDALGFRAVYVNEGFEALMEALSRADRKGYLPDAMVDEWEAFDYRTVLPAEPQESVDARPVVAMLDPQSDDAQGLAAPEGWWRGYHTGMQDGRAVGHAEANNTVLQNYLDDYQFDDGESATHSPGEFESMLICDAVHGLLANEEFLRTFDDWRSAVKAVKSATPPETPGHLVGAAPDGWRLAPERASPAMQKAAVVCAHGNAVFKCIDAKGVAELMEEASDAWAAMLAAAPSPQGEAPTSAPSPDQ